MGVFSNPDFDVIYSISEDKQLKTSSLKNKSVVQYIQLGSFPLSAMQGDLETSRMIITNKGGDIYIYYIGKVDW